MKFSMPNIIIRLEGLAVLAVSVGLYFHFGGTWKLFPVFLAPDIGIAAFVFGTKVGSPVYNLFHFYAIPLSCIAFHLITGQATVLFLVSLLWTAHIGMDRFLGFGLKYAGGFKDTHVQRV